MKKIIAVSIFFLFSFSCQSSQSLTNPEEKLLGMFQQELKLVKAYQDNYVDYMKYQVDHFPQKNKMSAEIIGAINHKFDKIPDEAKQEYQKQWQLKFQPVIDQIYQYSRSMIQKLKNRITPGIKAKVQEYSIKMELLEKDTADQKLAPKFFVTPGE